MNPQMQLDGEYREIYAVTVYGDRKPIKCIAFGAYAMHPQMIRGAGAVEGIGWAVSHVASGLAVWTVREWHEAIQIACWLKDNSPLPPNEPDPDSLTKWILEHSDARALLIQSLQKIAPKWNLPCGSTDS